MESQEERERLQRDELRQERASVEQVKEIIARLRRPPREGETYWDEDGPGRAVISQALREMRVNGCGGCPLCCS